MLSQDARNGKTALHLATESGCPGIVDLLTAYGASSGQASNDGVVPSELARKIRRGSKDLLEYYYS